MASVVLITCIPNMSHKVSLSFESLQESSEEERIETVAMAMPTVTTVETKFTTQRAVLLFSLNSSCWSLYFCWVESS